jgi:hypothetical protein
MTRRPDGMPGRRARLLGAVLLLVAIATIVVAILAYRDSSSAPPPGSGTFPGQAAEQSRAVR